MGWAQWVAWSRARTSPFPHLSSGHGCTMLPHSYPSCRTEAREQLRRQVGTLRFDVRAVAESLPKAEKKEAFAAGKQFLKQVSHTLSVVSVADRLGFEPRDHCREGNFSAQDHPWVDRALREDACSAILAITEIRASDDNASKFISIPHQTEALDLALRKKDETKALGLLDSTKSALDTVLAKLG